MERVAAPGQKHWIADLEGGIEVAPLAKPGGRGESVEKLPDVLLIPLPPQGTAAGEPHMIRWVAFRMPPQLLRKAAGSHPATKVRSPGPFYGLGALQQPSEVMRDSPIVQLAEGPADLPQAPGLVFPNS